MTTALQAWLPQQPPLLPSTGTPDVSSNRAAAGFAKGTTSWLRRGERAAAACHPGGWGQVRGAKQRENESWFTVSAQLHAFCFVKGEQLLSPESQPDGLCSQGLAETKLNESAEGQRGNDLWSRVLKKTTLVSEQLLLQGHTAKENFPSWSFYCRDDVDIFLVDQRAGEARVISEAWLQLTSPAKVPSTAEIN